MNIIYAALHMHTHAEKTTFRQLVQIFTCVRDWGQGTKCPEFVQPFTPLPLYHLRDWKLGSSTMAILWLAYFVIHLIVHPCKLKQRNICYENQRAFRVPYWLDLQIYYNVSLIIIIGNIGKFGQFLLYGIEPSAIFLYFLEYAAGIGIGKSRMDWRLQSVCTIKTESKLILSNSSPVWQSSLSQLN